MDAIFLQCSAPEVNDNVVVVRPVTGRACLAKQQKSAIMVLAKNCWRNDRRKANVAKPASNYFKVLCTARYRFQADVG
jgi:hypothetical protein